LVTLALVASGTSSDQRGASLVGDPGKVLLGDLRQPLDFTLGLYSTRTVPASIAIVCPGRRVMDITYGDGLFMIGVAHGIRPG
jgi:hypothetical protein